MTSPYPFEEWKEPLDKLCSSLFAYAAMEDGGNAIFCIPEKNLVVSIASEFIKNPGDRWTLIKEHILPAFKD